MTEVVEPARQLGRVGAEEGELFERVAEGRARLRQCSLTLLAVAPDGADRDLRQLRLQPGQVDEVVVAAGCLGDPVEVADGRDEIGRRGSEVAEERPEPVGDRLRGIDERVEVVERRPQVDRGRVEVPHEVGELRDRCLQRRPLAGDRVHHRVEVPDEGREVVAAGGDRSRQLRAVDDQLLERRRVAGQLGEGPARGRQERVQVLEALVGLLADAAVGGREALDDVLEVGDRVRVERVEELVQVDLGDRLRPRHRPAVGDLLPALALRRERQLDLAVGDPRQREGADLRGRPALERRVGLVDAEGDQGVAVVGQANVVDLADVGAPDRHHLAADELGGVREVGGDLVVGGVAAAGQDEDGGDGDDRDDGEDKRTTNQPRHARTLTVGGGPCLHCSLLLPQIWGLIPVSCVAKTNRGRFGRRQTTEIAGNQARKPRLARGFACRPRSG